MPLYNRASFLTRALNCIASQTYKDIEVIAVDDGSTDETQKTVNKIKQNYPFNIKYHYQENQGAAAARQAGIPYMEGDMVAFFDSDDLWEPEYLTIMAEHLTSQNLDWLYCPVKRQVMETGEVVSADSFYIDSTPRSFLNLKAIVKNNVNIFNDPLTVSTQIKSGLYLGFQNTLFHKKVFETIKIPNVRIGEDRLMTILLLKSFPRGGYIKKPLVTCFEHGNNTAVNSSSSIEKQIHVYKMLIDSYLLYPEQGHLNTGELKEWKKKISDYYFWYLGYNGYLAANNKPLALSAMFTGLKYTPANIRKWLRLVITYFQ